MRKIDPPWERFTRDPTTDGWPLTVRMILRDGYNIFLVHYTALRVTLAYYGSVGIALYFGYLAITEVGFKQLLYPPPASAGYWSVSLAVQNAGFLPDTLSELVFYLTGSTPGYWLIALGYQLEFLNSLPQIVPWVVWACICILVWWGLCLRVTLIRMTLNRARFRWLALRAWDRAYISDFLVEECPRSRGHAGQVLRHFDIQNPYLNTYRIYAIYGTSKIKVADVYGQAHAEAACEKLRRINDFLNTQIDREMPIDIDTGR